MRNLWELHAVNLAFYTFFLTIDNEPLVSDRIPGGSFMVYEVARAAVQRIFQDKILMGLVIVGILAIFIGGFGSDTDRPPTGGPRQDGQGTTPSPSSSSLGQTGDPNAKVDPVLATDFIKWWISNAMDFNSASAQQSHSQAMSWMTPEAVQTFQSTFWTPEIADGVKTGRITATFQPTGIQAMAANPDGSVVVCVTGNWVIHQGPKPMMLQFIADFLVKKDQDGLRVAGLYNRSQAQPGASVY